jgi:hypothetical protein
MKTTKLRLLATIITLAAVITATIPANAQRRSTTTSSNNEKVENTRTGNKENIEKKSAHRKVAKEPKAANRSVRSSEEIKRNGTPAVNEKSRESTRNASRSGENSVRTDSDFKTNQKSANNRERSTYSSSKNNRAAATTNSERYNLNADDVRYKPTRDYKGNNKYWSSDYRGDNRGNNRHNEKYNYSNYKHWDRNWESYRWNHISWRNYYGYYNPYSFRNHKYYYHHNYYGHVIRKFGHKPHIYIHNRTKYYCYDGYFFRHRSGIGYVLADVPFGMAFDYLPRNYERVYINGYLYFRVGNLFFERTNYGFLLVHYPERYYAYNDGYRGEGYRFNDLNF